MSSQHTNSRSLSLIGASRWSVALRIVMLVAAWQGPVPWCHCHGTLTGSDAAKTPSWLAAHLQTHHASVSPFGGRFLGWHMHAVLPGASTDDPDQPKKVEQFQLPATGASDSLMEQLAHSTDGLSVTLAQRIEFQSSGLAGSIDSQTLSAAHFFDHFAPSLPLPLRFCVARC